MRGGIVEVLLSGGQIIMLVVLIMGVGVAIGRSWPKKKGDWI